LGELEGASSLLTDRFPCHTIYKYHSRSEYRFFSPFRGRCQRKARSAGGRGGQLHSRSEYRFFSPPWGS
jgi:hypothetical protein